MGFTSLPGDLGSPMARGSEYQYAESQWLDTTNDIHIFQTAVLKFGAEPASLGATGKKKILGFPGIGGGGGHGEPPQT